MGRPKKIRPVKKPGTWMGKTDLEQMEYRIKNLDRVIADLRTEFEEVKKIDHERRIKVLEGFHL